MKAADIATLVKTCESFVVQDYSLDSENPDEPPVTSVVPASALFEVIEDAHRHSKRIVISPVGPPIINWHK